MNFKNIIFNKKSKNSMIKVKKIKSIKGLSQEFDDSPQIVRQGRNIILKYDYEIENVGLGWHKITFTDVIASKLTKEICIELYMINAYDAISMVIESEWLEYIQENYKGTQKFDYKHYLIYFEDHGCYEFIAKQVIDEDGNLINI
ncbi:hypothetical protein [Clostridium botulinum]|uniref:hypothetical protein n=1 Tax=Clostridium botulinum TaxID=1491 RepID=UPI000304841B|nr:hypothetical protein [Clostridium botulinum]KLU74976.1 hypothetical protein CBC3_10970 [Clostridium botulinum V891]KOA77971.1 hypothetical protein ADU78_02550 [Clostridium botulinum]KOA95109.1 hypothetical protein ADU76_01735 [Clostridium botulinum]MCD3201824.1 hypothetical protein [Clostridium botulinum C/D]MCD3221379.1 hypothetical protein [Clostridium botulinum C/D]